MDITTEQNGDVLVVRLDGRLDAYWADHLSRSLEDAVSTGGHRIEVRMSSVSYMSSVGLRVLVKFYKQLGAIGGSLSVGEASDPVRNVIRMAGLETLLAGAGPQASPRTPSAPVRHVETERARYDIFELDAAATLSLRLVGSPHALENSGYADADCRTFALPATSFAVGLGAFGGFGDCHSRFGELIAAAGAAAYFPTDGTNVPDYLLSVSSNSGTSAPGPELSFLYALICDGRFRNLLRFEETRRGDAVPLSQILAQALAISGSSRAGIVMLAETSGLVGATLRRSPARGPAATIAEPHALFEYPNVRDWLSYSSEPSHRRRLALVAGVITSAADPLVDPFVRPLGQAPWPAGHFHAAVFPSRPLAKGRIELGATVASLFENETLEAVLHLLADDRANVGAGQSELVRGACWVAPIASVEGGDASPRLGDARAKAGNVSDAGHGLPPNTGNASLPKAGA